MPPTLEPFREPIYTVVDDEDFDWLNEHRWFLAAGSNYVQGYVNDSYVRMHRLIMQCYQPREDPDAWDVRHKDRKKLHNNRANLEWILCRRQALKHHRGQRL